MPICELCGKSDFVKEDGLFVCQGCGTKYTPEEAKKLREPLPGKTPLGTAEGVAAAAIAFLIDALNSAADFNPDAAAQETQDARGINNYICQGWQLVVDEYKKNEHPTRKELDAVVAKAKECLVALNGAALIEPDKYVQNTIIYKNCEEIEESVRDLDCYEMKEGEWSRISFPVSSSDLKIAGQSGSWKEKREGFEKAIEQEYLDAHPDEVATLDELKSMAAGIQAELDELKDEKKSKGLFNFSEKKEVKERMAPVKERLSGVNDQIRAIERNVEKYVDGRLDDLESSFVRLSF